MLPQPDNDNAQGDLSPMISGRGTKIIADARGAYLAGNLRALTELMTAEHDQRFREVVLDQAASVVRALLGELGLTNPAAHPALQALDALMADPIPENTARVLNCFFEPEREPDFSNAAITNSVGEDAIQAVSSIAMPFVSLVRARFPYGAEQSMWVVVAMAGQRLRERGYLTRYWWASASATPQQISSHVHRWLVEAGWAVLTGKPVPSFDDASQFGSYSLLG